MFRRCSQSPRAVPFHDRRGGEQGHAGTGREKGRGVSSVRAPTLFFSCRVEITADGTFRKHAVETTEMLDFLKEIVESVPDPSAGGTIDLEAEAAEGSKRKRGKTKKNGAPGTSGEPKKRRKKKTDGDADGAGEEGAAGAKSEPEADAAMDEDDDKDGHVEPSHRDQEADWRDDEDLPYIPR